MNQKHLIFRYDSLDSKRLDIFLVSSLPDHSRAFLQGLIKQGLVKVNDEVATKTGYKLEGHQTVEIVIPPPTPSDLIPENIPLAIIHEDHNLIIVNKPAGMVTHPSAGHQTGTLVHAILAHAPDIQGVGGVLRPGIVHRLDKDTSGLIIIAKNDRAHQYLQSLFKLRTVSKTYIAIVDSHPPTPTGRVEAAIGRDTSNRQMMAIVPEKKGRMAISEYATAQTFPKHSMLEISIHTGRTHQIRLHMAFLKCPVVGDKIYGYKKPTLPVTRQLLHAYRITFVLPDDSAPRTFQAPLPQDFIDTLELLKNQG